MTQIPKAGDRSAVDTINYANLHADDIAASAPTVHTPAPTVAGDIIQSATNGGGFKWITTTLQAIIHATSSKTPPVDNDEFALIDSAASYGLKKLTWANLKTTLKSYFDGIYSSLSGGAIAGGLTINEDGGSDASSDFRVESDTESNMIFLDASTEILYLGGTTNGIKISKGGELELIGTATYYVDIDFPIIIRTTGTGIPALTTMNGNLTAPQWQVGDFNMCESQEFIHQWLEASTCNFHIHLTTNGLDAADRYVRFEVEAGWVNPSGQWNWLSTIDSGDLLIAANTPSQTMKILTLGTFTPSGGKIGGHVLARLKRIASSGTAPTNDPWVPMLQLHVECDTMGSKTITNK